MMKLIVLCALFALAVCQHDHHASMNAEATHLFTIVDTDRNGEFSMDELTEVFGRFDVNQDDRVTQKEFYLDLCGASPEICRETLGLFQVMDTLNEGVLWKSNLKSIFDLFDTNDNGSITRSEFVTLMTNKLTELKPKQG